MLAALARGTSVARLLGELVERELRRRGERGTAAVEAEAPAPDQALAALTAARAGIVELDQIAGRLERSAAASGASWSDVASSLGLEPEVAERAYGRSGG